MFLQCAEAKHMCVKIYASTDELYNRSLKRLSTLLPSAAIFLITSHHTGRGERWRGGSERWRTLAPSAIVAGSRSTVGGGTEARSHLGAGGASAPRLEPSKDGVAACPTDPARPGDGRAGDFRGYTGVFHTQEKTKRKKRERVRKLTTAFH